MIEPIFMEFEGLSDYHEEALKIDPDSREGTLDDNLLKSACGSAIHQFHYHAAALDECEGYAYLAAHYWTRLAQNHGYQDANNRTAMLVALGFLRENGYKVAMSNGDLKELGHAIASHKLDREAVALVLAPKLTPNP